MPLCAFVRVCVRVCVHVPVCSYEAHGFVCVFRSSGHIKGYVKLLIFT